MPPEPHVTRITEKHLPGPAAEPLLGAEVGNDRHGIIAFVAAVVLTPSPMLFGPPDRRYALSVAGTPQQEAYTFQISGGALVTDGWYVID